MIIVEYTKFTFALLIRKDTIVDISQKYIHMFVTNNNGLVFLFTANFRVRSASIGSRSNLIRHGEYAVLDPSNGRSLYVFDATGKHLRTVDIFTRQIVLKFLYDENNRLSGRLTIDMYLPR